MSEHTNEPGEQGLCAEENELIALRNELRDTRERLFAVEKQIDDAYDFLIGGISPLVKASPQAHEHMVESMRAQPLLVHFKMAANTIKSQRVAIETAEGALLSLEKLGVKAQKTDNGGWLITQVKHSLKEMFIRAVRRTRDELDPRSTEADEDALVQSLMRGEL